MAKKKVKGNEFYSLKNILEKDATYSVIIGERSNGKTYAVLNYCLENYFATGEQFAIVRRWADDIRPKRSNNLFNGHAENGVITKLSNGKYNGVEMRTGAFYLTYYDETEEKQKRSDEIIGYAFALNTQEHDKSTSFPRITTIFFDEFLTRQFYLPDEFILFMNVCSTIIRDRNNVKIFMCGNTVNQYSPYFAEMGLTRVKQMKKGTIDVYSYGDSNLRVAVEYSDFPAKKKKSDHYFAFDNPKLKMITTGAWEVVTVPHLPLKYNYLVDVVFTFYLIFDGEMLQGDVIVKDGAQFIYIHRKTTPIKDPQHSLVYSDGYSPYPSWRRSIFKIFDEIGKKIARLFLLDKVFYQDNAVGEIVRNYLMWAKKNQLG